MTKKTAEAKKASENLSPTNAAALLGRRGGMTVLEKHGMEHYHRMSKLGVEARKKNARKRKKVAAVDKKGNGAK